MRPFVSNLYWFPEKLLDMKNVEQFFSVEIESYANKPYAYAEEPSESTIRMWEERYRYGEQWIGFPRGCPNLIDKCLYGKHIIRDKRTKVPVDIPLKLTGEYFGYQLPAVKVMCKSDNGVLKAPPRMGKCVAGDTLVFTDSGIMPIKDLFPNKKTEQAGDFGKIKTHRGLRKIEGLYQKKVDKVVHMRTRMGYELTGTPNHPILVLTEALNYRWRKLSSIKQNDQICLNTTSGIWTNKKEISIDMAELIGYFVANGSLNYASSGRISITTNNKKIQQRICILLRTIFGAKYKFIRDRGKVFTLEIRDRQIIEKLEKSGLDMVLSAKKCIPDTIMKSSKDTMTTFLRAYTSCDSYLGQNLQLCSASRKLMDQVAVVLTNYGIVGSRKSKEAYARNSRTPTVRTYYLIEIRGRSRTQFLKTFKPLKEYKIYADSFQYLVGRIPYVLNHLRSFRDKYHCGSGVYKKNGIKVLMKMPDLWRNNLSTLTKDDLKNVLKRNKAFRDFDEPLYEKLRRISRHTVIYDTVSHVETINKPTKVYDVSIPSTKSFIGNGIVCHNTVIGVGIIIEKQQKSLIVAHQKDLVEQFINQTINNSAGGLFNGDTLKKPVAKICRTYDDFKNHSICLVTYQTFISDKGQRLLNKVKDMFGLVLVDECFHPSHEFLTSKGWKKVDKISKKDKIAQVDVKTKHMSFVESTRLIKRKFKGSLINIHSQKYDLLGTPNHEHLLYRGMYHNENLLDDPIKVKFKNLPLRCAHKILLGIIPEKKDNKTISVHDRFLIALQADGTLVHTAKNGIKTYRFSFRKERKIKRLRKILENLDYRWEEYNLNIRKDKSFCVWVPANIEKSFDWFTPYTRSYKECDSFLWEVTRWDGTETKDGIHQFDSANESSIDKIQEVVVYCGYISTKSRPKKQKSYHSDRFRVSWYDGIARGIDKSIHKNLVKYEGYVYCVEMPKGTVVTRRNGKVSVTGNCHRAPAVKYSEIISKFSAKYMYGLTATPDRKDNKWPIIELLLGSIAYEIKRDRVLSPKVYGHTTGFRPPPVLPKTWQNLNTMLYNSKIRNNNIVDGVVRDVENGHHVLIPINRLKLAQTLEDMINERLGRRVCFLFTGKIPENKRQWARDQMRYNKNISVTIATRSMLLGIDVPNWSCVVGNTYLPTNRGIIRIDELYPGKPHAARHVLHNGKKQAYSIYGGSPRYAKTLTVELQRGHKIEVSIKHRFLILDSDFKLKFKEAYTLNEGDYIVQKSAGCMVDNYYALNDYLFDPQRRYGIFQNKDMDGKIECGICKERTKNLSVHTKRVHGNKVTSKVSWTAYQRWKRAEALFQNKIKYPKEVTPRLGYIIGFLLTDGCINYEKKYIEFYNTNFTLLDKIKSYIKREFNINPSGDSTKERKGYKIVRTLQYYDARFIDFMDYLGVRGKAWEKELPACIMQSPREVISSFLGAYLDADGTVAVSKRKNNRGYIETLYFLSSNRKRLEHMQILIFHIYGVMPYLRETSQKVGDIHKSSIGIVKTKHQLYKLILNNGSAVLLANELKLYSYKAVKISKRDSGTRTDIPYGHELLKERLRTLLIRKRHWAGYIVDNKEISFTWRESSRWGKTVETVREKPHILDMVKKLAPDIGKVYSSIVEKGLIPVKIRSIHKNDTAERVYDVSMKDASNPHYISGVVISHNCVYTICPINNPPTYMQEILRITTPMKGKRRPIIRYWADPPLGISYGCLRGCANVLLDPVHGFEIKDSFKNLVKSLRGIQLPHDLGVEGENFSVSRKIMPMETQIKRF